MRVVAILLIQFFVFIPTNLYLGNIDQFNVTILNMLRLSAVPGLVLFILFAIIERFLTRESVSRITVVLSVLSILIWFQSNVIVWDYGVLDGRIIDWTKAQWRGLVDTSIWLICLTGSIVIYKYLKKNIFKWVLTIFILQFLTITYACIENWSSIQAREVLNTEEDLVELSNFSTKNNILHILIDGFQSDVFLDLVTDEQLGTEYRKSFNGFEFYAETLGVFPYTRFAVPAILSGRMYSNDVPKDQFLDTVLSDKTILNIAKEFGYEIDMAIGDHYFAKRYANTKFTNFYEIREKDKISETIKLLDLSLFRLAPHFIKPYIYNNQEWMLQTFISGEYPAGTYFAHTVFLNNFISDMHVARAVPVYKYFHVMNTHNPMVTNPSCGYAGSVLVTNRATLTLQSKCTLDTLKRLFEKMKILNIYNRSLIIVHADHGGWVENRRKGKSIVFADGSVALHPVASLASPLLMIKLPDATEDFRISTVLASLVDIPDTISDVMNWDVDFGHKSLLKIDADAIRERRYRFYFWQRDAWESDYTGPIQEFIINGSHYEEKWQIGTVYPPPE